MVVKTNLASVGIKELALENKFNVYPNPSGGVFNLSCENAKEFSYKIYYTTGMLVEENKTFSKDLKVDLSDLPNGIYLMHVISGNSTAQVIKLSKK